MSVFQHGETKETKTNGYDSSDDDVDIFNLTDEELEDLGYKRLGRFLIKNESNKEPEETQQEIQYTLGYVKRVEDSILQLEHSMKTVRHNNAQHKRILLQKLEQLRKAKRTIDRKIDELENTVITLIRALDN